MIAESYEKSDKSYGMIFELIGDSLGRANKPVTSLISAKKSELNAHVMNKRSCLINRSFRNLALLVASMSASISIGFSQQDSILLFLSDHDTYYSEYVVMFESLTASGYYVDVRNAGSSGATMYTIGGVIDVTA